MTIREMIEKLEKVALEAPKGDMTDLLIQETGMSQLSSPDEFIFCIPNFFKEKVLIISLEGEY